MGTAPRALGRPLALPREVIRVTGWRVLASSTDGLGFGLASYLIVLDSGESGTSGAANLVADLRALSGIADGVFVIAGDVMGDDG
jgi:hypothetical protein